MLYEPMPIGSGVALVPRKCFSVITKSLSMRRASRT